MDVNTINGHLAAGTLADVGMFGHLQRLANSPFVFKHSFGLDVLPTEPGIIVVRGPRQYGKSTWLEQQIVATIQTFGAGTAFYLNGDFLADAEQLSRELEQLARIFNTDAPVKRIFIDEITAIKDWERILKRLVDNGTLDKILIITTGSDAFDLRRGVERLPGRKGKLAKTNYLFTPLSYRNFYDVCHSLLKEKTLIAYILSGGSPIACTELASSGFLPDYVIQLVRDWIEGTFARDGRQRASLVNVLAGICRFGGTPVGQAKLAREANLANNTIAQAYIESLNDLGCVVPAFSYDAQRNNLILRKPCKYHFINLLAAATYYPSCLRRVADFEQLPPSEQGLWYEWIVAQELQRRSVLRQGEILAPLAFWQSKNHEIDFYDDKYGYIEVKRGSCTPFEFGWFSEQFKGQVLTVINQNTFSTPFVKGVTLEDFLLEE